MLRAIGITMLCTAVLWGGFACAPQQPTPPQLSASGYTINLRVEPSEDIWITPPDSNLPGDYHGFGVVFVEVTDAQGRLVDDVPVTFRLPPGWESSASLRPQQTRTRNGTAHVVFEPRTSGRVHIMAQVDNRTQEAIFTVNTRSGPGSASGGPFGGGMPTPRSSYY